MSEKDQAAETDAQSTTKTLEELVDEGWAEYEATASAEPEVVAKDKPSPASTGDKGDKKDSPAPYKTLKVGGKDVPVSSEEELIALAQKGLDYTQKTQGLSKDRKDAETKIKSEHDALTAEAKRLNDLLDKLQASRPDLWKEATAKDKAEEKEEDIFKEFDIDPETALSSEKKMASATANLRKEIKTLRELVDEERTSRAIEKFTAIVDDEKKKYPFKETFDDQGRPTHLAKLEELIMAKKSAIESVGGKFDVVKSAREAVKELYELQQSAPTEDEASEKKDSGESTVQDDMDLEEFKKKFPGISQKLSEAALMAEKEQRSKLPPTVKGLSSAPVVMTKSVKESYQGKSLDEILEAGLKDPDIAKAFQGE